MSHPHLESWFEHFLARYVEHKDTEEVALSRARTRHDSAPTELWIKSRTTSRWEPATLEMSHEEVMDFMRLAAMTNGSNFGAHKPIVHTTLPRGHRMMGVGGDVVRYYQDSTEGVAWNIRQATGGEAGDGLGLTMAPAAKAKFTVEPTSDLLAPVIESFIQGKGIVFVGGMSTGKTTQLRRLLGRLQPYTRALIIEDTRELTPSNLPNRLQLFKSRTDGNNAVTWEDLINIATRSSPDLVVVGEVSPATAPHLATLMSLGHGRFLTSFHAPTADVAVSKLYSQMQEGGSQVRPEGYGEMLLEGIAFFVVLGKDEGGHRYIKEIKTPHEVLLDLPFFQPPRMQRAGVKSAIERTEQTAGLALWDGERD